eukprot:GDKI01046641.1.p2 GENE.GDKI01046641.1~~GDKI01046641.1.p2  ORF type:complete len:133 (-),score=17.60 GDKI01046641.1:979-1377(-)
MPCNTRTPTKQTVGTRSLGTSMRAYSHIQAWHTACMHAARQPRCRCQFGGAGFDADMPPFSAVKFELVQLHHCSSDPRPAHTHTAPSFVPPTQSSARCIDGTSPPTQPPIVLPPRQPPVAVFSCNAPLALSQ